jgi:hypothetical protein
LSKFPVGGSICAGGDCDTLAAAAAPPVLDALEAVLVRDRDSFDAYSVKISKVSGILYR